MRLKMTLKARALRYLSIREYSPKELAQKLMPYVEEGDDTSSLLQWLKAQGFLSEERFVEAYVRRRSARYGSVRILRELQSHDLNEDTLLEAKLTMSENEFERALIIWQRKYDQKSINVLEKAKQIRFLQQRGFSNEIIRRVMKWKAPD